MIFLLGNDLCFLSNKFFITLFWRGWEDEPKIMLPVSLCCLLNKDLHVKTIELGVSFPLQRLLSNNHLTSAKN